MTARDESRSASESRVELPWPPYVAQTVCGHIERPAVSVAYPVTDWCETCGHYVTVYFKDAALSAGSQS